MSAIALIANALQKYKKQMRICYLRTDIFEKTYDAETTSFKERLIKEHEELSDKLVKLYTFGSTEKFKELDPIHQQLLIIQSGSMATYNETLKLRLGLL